MMRATKAKFTLIELLVVIAIISILAAMLLPALQQARDRSKNAACINTVKSLGSAFTFYNDDYKGFYPYFATQVSGADWERWSAVMSLKCKYLLHTSNFLCPGNPGKPGNYWYDLLRKNARPARTNAMWGYIDYGYNKTYIGGGDNGDPPTHSSHIKHPAKTIILGDASVKKDLSNNLGYYTVMSGFWEDGLLRARHNGALTILWGDAHVSSEQISNDYNPYEGSIFENRTKGHPDNLWDIE